MCIYIYTNEWPNILQDSPQISCFFRISSSSLREFWFKNFPPRPSLWHQSFSAPSTPQLPIQPLQGAGNPRFSVVFRCSPSNGKTVCFQGGTRSASMCGNTVLCWTIWGCFGLEIVLKSQLSHGKPFSSGSSTFPRGLWMRYMTLIRDTKQQYLVKTFWNS